MTGGEKLPKQKKRRVHAPLGLCKTLSDSLEFRKQMMLWKFRVTQRRSCLPALYTGSVGHVAKANTFPSLTMRSRKRRLACTGGFDTRYATGRRWLQVTLSNVAFPQSRARVLVRRSIGSVPTHYPPAFGLCPSSP